ncbi:hypothetical protein [Janibacter terrae]|uniref:hypothetical protein n=1 Tax=Janibacter terrae TaxID=103817 RepID=UPI0031F83C50
MDTRALPFPPARGADRHATRDIGTPATPLDSLTVRELIARLARTEDQLNLARLQDRADGAGQVGHLLAEQRAVIRELRRRH